MKPTKEMICSDEGTEHQATTNKQTNKQRVPIMRRSKDYQI
jgi:hypothetical protein